MASRIRLGIIGAGSIARLAHVPAIQQMPEAEFKEERASEYAYLKARGELDSYRVEPAASWWRKIAVIVGVSAMSIGLALAALIILATLKVI